MCRIASANCIMKDMQAVVQLAQVRCHIRCNSPIPHTRRAYFAAAYCTNELNMTGVARLMTCHVSVSGLCPMMQTPTAPSVGPVAPHAVPATSPPPPSLASSRPRRQVRRPKSWNDCTSDICCSSDDDGGGHGDDSTGCEGDEVDSDDDDDAMDGSSDEDGNKRHSIRPHGKSTKARVITRNALREVYDLPINEAASQLGIGVTVLKKYCRKFDIKRWPYRKRKSMLKLIHTVETYAKGSGNGLNCLPVLQELRCVGVDQNTTLVTIVRGG